MFLLNYLFLCLKFWASSEGCLKNMSTCQGGQAVRPTSSFLGNIFQGNISGIVSWGKALYWFLETGLREAATEWMESMVK